MCLVEKLALRKRKEIIKEGIRLIRLLWCFFVNNDMLTCLFNLGVWDIGDTRRDISVAIELYFKVKHGRHA